jgi:hypothetical protein
MAAVFSKWKVEALVTVGACRVSRLDSAKKGLLPAAARESAGVTRVVKALITRGVKTGNGSTAGGTCPTTVCKRAGLASTSPARERDNGLQ